ncbi:MAG TPA: F0F1 ATP synthase subunit epsilon [Epulopiscium sp.]|nr:F0F1 ATP synthase subunit epsilon [Candidatus Epulonipiscium sp.]
MADKKLRLQIITPVRVLCDEMVDMVIMRASTGDMGILPNHEPVVATLNYGILRFKQDGKERKATIMSGFAEVEPDKVTILTDAAEWPEEIDLARAEEAKKRALKRLDPPKKAENNTLRAEIALKKALVRIEARR